VFHQHLAANATVVSIWMMAAVDMLKSVCFKIKVDDTGNARIGSATGVADAIEVYIIDEVPCFISHSFMPCLKPWKNHHRMSNCTGGHRSTRSTGASVRCFTL
jgi:hypothetical protein